jgi:hypothetical protein
MNDDTLYLRVISHFLKGLWLFLIGMVVYQFFAGISDIMQASYLTCVDENSIFDCSNSSGLFAGLSFFASAPIFFFAGMAGFEGVKGLNVIEAE